MRYLTKVVLGPEALRQYAVRDAYSVHRLVYSWFPLGADEVKSDPRFLYADLGPTRTGRAILILSAQEPVLPETLPSATTVLGENFFSFEDFRFQVDLNPVKRDRVDGKRHPVVGQLNLLMWFISHAQQWGFQVDKASLEARTCPIKTFCKGTTKYTFHHVRFQGRLKVVDQALFQKTVFEGIGHGKAFGFGLLQLVPLRKF